MKPGAFRWRRTAVLMAVVLSLFCTLAAGAPQEAAAAPPAKKDYIGSENCQPCHEDIYQSFQKNRHSVVEVEKKRGWAGRSCEACHGPGSVHAETVAAADILNPGKAPATQSIPACMKCHANQPTNVGYVNSSHVRNLVACTGCHSMHAAAAGPPTTNRNERVTNLCLRCHTNQRASFQRPHTHPVRQGAMSCIDCHNPHGSAGLRQTQIVNANEPGCFKCHGDKRGPFTYEHAPVRLEGCLTCHEPHGSANPRMLTRHEVSFQCLECHSNIGLAGGGTNTGAMGGIPPAFHDLRSARFRNCTLCHVKVHGSYVNRALLR